MSDPPRPGLLFGGLPAEPAEPEPPAHSTAPAPGTPQQPDARTLPDVPQGPRAPIPPDEGAQLAAAWRRMSGLPLAG